MDLTDNLIKALRAIGVRTEFKHYDELFPYGTNVSPNKYRVYLTYFVGPNKFEKNRGGVTKEEALLRTICVLPNDLRSQL